ncbi:MAG: hypothetical protein WKF96_11765 [Solirubrobacteraceae bacterium]
MNEGEGPNGWGCGAIIAFVMVVGLVVAAAISLAALVDPFSWMPSVDQVWADCEDDFATERDECALASRFDGFWIHAAVNLLYLAGSLGLLAGLAFAVADQRKARGGRFAGDAAAQRYADARQTLVITSGLVGIVSLVPIVAAVA